MSKRLVVNIIELLAKLIGVKVPPYATTGAIITKDGKVLMVKLSYKNGYNLPGGYVEPGENLEEGLKRELKEELNMEVEEIRYLASATENKGKLWTVVAGFEVKIRDYKIMTGSDEGRPEWLEPGEAYEKCVYLDSREIIKQYFRLQ